MLAFVLHAQTFTFNMYDANNQSKKITVTVNTSSQKVSAKSGNSTLFSFSYYGHYIYKEKYRIGLSPVPGGTVDVNASSSNYFIVIRDNGNILVCLNGKEYPMRSVNNSATQSTYDQLTTALNPPPPPPPPPSNNDYRTFTVNGVSFHMVYVQGGTFTMGATSEQGDDYDSDEKPTHSVTLSSYMIGQTEVTQALWQAVMGNNPSRFTGDSRRPVELVSWNDCQTFLRKLNSLTGQRFRLPTEAEWEFAARGGVNSRGYKYSGSNTLDNVAWYDSNACDGVGSNSPNYGTHPVGTKAANELGIYDMSGNVWEWCSDWYGSYSSSSQTNPQGPSSGSIRVLRGGSWYDSTRRCRVSCRSFILPDYRYFNDGLRLVLNITDNTSPPPPSNTSTDMNKTFTANGVSFTMVYVQGGTFTMGATSEQGSDAYDWEKPTHSVTLSSYMIGQTEVTQALWQAVMGNNPSRFTGDSRRPVEEVSWDDCQEFLRKLNSITGQKFRLPTEAEWEFAARGGNKSNHYKYSGSNTLGNVAWYEDNSGITTHPVGTKAANELGIYDMSGNVWEWCNDWYGNYSSSSQTNPQGPSSGSYRVLRGGCWSSNTRDCRVSFRLIINPDYRDNGIGLRLAF